MDADDIIVILQVITKGSSSPWHPLSDLFCSSFQKVAMNQLFPLSHYYDPSPLLISSKHLQAEQYSV